MQECNNATTRMTSDLPWPSICAFVHFCIRALVMLVDTFGRPLRNLRLSVTDRCNLRCEYCMPEDDYVWLPREDVLHFEEISALVDVFVALGVDKVRLTGGEPLLRRDLPALVRMLAAKTGLTDLALTTNGVLLADQIDALRAAGLGRITVSLDTLEARPLRRADALRRLDAVHEGMQAAARVFGRFKIDTVVMRGVNDDELVGPHRVRDARGTPRSGSSNTWTSAAPRAGRRTASCRGRRCSTRWPRTTGPSSRSSSAHRRRPTAIPLPDGTVFGIISSTTEPFCRSCDRSRLTADGMWYLCLYAQHGIDLRAPSAEALRPTNWPDSSAPAGAPGPTAAPKSRLALGERRAFVPIRDLLRDPHLEMHTRGG